MSWLQTLYDTYENNSGLIGKLNEGKTPLLPICHTTQQVQVTITLDGSGQFLRAKGNVPEERTTIIPCTEASGSRTSKPVPHPLVDKLQYIAGDYNQFGGTKKSCWSDYLAQLGDWCHSPFAHPDVCLVFRYVQQGRLIADLVDAGVLFCDSDGKLLSRWEDGNPPLIFQKTASEQLESFVRFEINDGVRLPVRLWEDRSVWDSFQQYQMTLLTSKDWCYVQGKQMPVSSLNPYKIRNAGDRAKLVSANDSSNFTYRGRFSQPEQAFSLGYETSQKAHSALRWLIGLQGFLNGDQAIVAWGTKNQPVPNLLQDSLDLSEQADCSSDGVFGSLPVEPPQRVPHTRREYAVRLSKAIAGYKGHLTESDHTAVMMVDSATPGRLSIRYYREMPGSELIERVQCWHDEHFGCTWLLEYRSVAEPSQDANKKPKMVHVKFWGAPSPVDIVKAAYGERVDDKLKKNTIERILIPCIIDQAPLPRDLVWSAARRASRPESMEEWEWHKTLSIACALVRKYENDRQKKEVWTMSLDRESRHRDYVFGRMLACAHQIEQYAQKLSSEKRSTNAQKFQLHFSMKPASTWEQLEHRLQPYRARLGPKADWIEQELQNAMDKLSISDMSDQSLGPVYLLGYSHETMFFSQEMQRRKELNQAKNTPSSESDDILD